MTSEDLEKILVQIEELPDCNTIRAFSAALLGELEEEVISVDTQIAMLTSLTNPATLIATLIAHFSQMLLKTEADKFKLIADMALIVEALNSKAHNLNCKL